MNFKGRELNFADADGGDDEENPAWLTSYSDMMTDLLAVFVILFSFAMMSVSNQNYQLKNELEQETQQEMQAGDGDNTLEGIGAENSERLDELIRSMRSYIDDNGLSGQLSVTKQGNDKVLLRVADSALFDSGRANITESSEEILYNISSILKKHTDLIEMVRIEGHTDNRPIHTAQFNSNWELSTSRAVNVLKWLSEASPLDPDKFSAVGYGEFHPVSENDTEQGRAANRRVDFVIET